MLAVGAGVDYPTSLLSEVTLFCLLLVVLFFHFFLGLFHCCCVYYVYCLVCDSRTVSTNPSILAARFAFLYVFLLSAGRPKAALLFWIFSVFRCGEPLFTVVFVIYIGKNRC